MYKLFSREAVQRDEGSWTWWSPIINNKENNRDYTNTFSSNSRFSSTTDLQHYQKCSVALRWAADTKSKFYVYIGWLASVMKRDDDGNRKRHILPSRGRFALTGRECPWQCGHNDFQIGR